MPYREVTKKDWLKAGAYILLTIVVIAADARPAPHALCVVPVAKHPDEDWWAGREDDILPEPTSSHETCLTARRACRRVGCTSQIPCRGTVLGTALYQLPTFGSEVSTINQFTERSHCVSISTA
jgi:hypothetical protein